MSGTRFAQHGINLWIRIIGISSNFTATAALHSAVGSLSVFAVSKLGWHLPRPQPAASN